MHILILPSEEFVPEREPLAGIFQLDQARILKYAGYKVGVLSIRLRYSAPMIMKAVLKRLAGRKSQNDTDIYSFLQLFSLFFNKIFRPSLYIREEQVEGIDVYRIEGFYRLPPSQKTDYRWWIRAGKELFKHYINKNGRPDIIHAHNAVYAGMLAQNLKEQHHVDYILTEHSSYFSRKMYHNSLLSYAYAAFKNARQLFVVSAFLGKGLEEIFCNLDYKVLPNVVHPDFEHQPLNKKQKTTYSVISIGNLIHLKRHALLIRAFHKAFSADVPISLSIIGEGPEKESLQQLIETLGESNRIHLKGRFSKPQILQAIDEADVLCLQSEYETFGVVVLESLFRGTPVITTLCGGPDEVVTSKDGLAITVDDEKAMVEALKKMYFNKNLFDPMEIRASAIQRYGAIVFLKSIQSFFSIPAKKALPAELNSNMSITEI